MKITSYSVSAQDTVKWPQIVAGLSAAGGAFAVGTALGWPAPAGPRLVGGDDRFFPIDQSRFEWAASIITIGCAISCLPIGFLMKAFGRKWTMIGLVVPFLVGWSLVIWAQNFVMLMVGRFMLGLAGGAFCVSAPQYSAEIAEKEIRGIVGTFFQVLINGGILFVYVIGAFMSVFWMSVICGIVPLVFGLIFFFMPESPVYLVIKKRDDDATKTYKWLRGENYDPQVEIDELKMEVEENERNKISFGEVLKRKATQRALFIGFGLMFFQQVSGINIVIFYATDIFEASAVKFHDKHKLDVLILGCQHWNQLGH
jgi:SP family facilitated glucose transporter-like MFS transporter 8